MTGHELTHALSDRTAGLLPYGESGAIAESLADSMGELIDQWSTTSGADPTVDRWAFGEQLPGGAIRDLADPTLFGDPDRMTSLLPRPAASEPAASTRTAAWATRPCT